VPGEASEEWGLVAQELVAAGLTCLVVHREPLETATNRRSLFSRLSDIEEVVIGCDVEGPVVLVCAGVSGSEV
jgi:hypothetical protein